MIEEERTIQRMSDTLASQVAAGEVVERPASVVKELVENSIDAHAKSIRVEISRGGVASIKVADDGDGMSRADLEMCLERHATSKLRTYEELFDIHQMGFRGEALPSIASVAQVAITTRRKQDVEGSRLDCHGGELQEIRAAGCPPGTEIEVRDLFYNTPARRKFLKSLETESGHIEQQLKLHALAFPDLRFTFIRDGDTVFDTPATPDLRHRISEFYGKENAGKLLRIRPTTGVGVHVEGYLMPLTDARRNRRLQYIFLNGRPIEDKMVSRAVRDGYGGFPTGLQPGYFVYIEMDPALVDVNVHPAKREVRFRRPADLTAAVMDAISATLAEFARGGRSAEPETTSCPLPRLLARKPLMSLRSGRMKKSHPYAPPCASLWNPGSRSWIYLPLPSRKRQPNTHTTSPRKSRMYPPSVSSASFGTNTAFLKTQTVWFCSPSRQPENASSLSVSLQPISVPFRRNSCSLPPWWS